jgi:hypothetical protein
MIDLSTNIYELPVTESEDFDGQNQSRNEIVMKSVERFREALKKLGTGNIYRRVILEGKVTKEATLGTHRITPMENVDDELYMKVLQVYSEVKWG